MRYRITGNNGNGEFVIYDTQSMRNGVTKSVHTDEIRDRMFTGGYDFTITHLHPAYDEIKLRKTIVTITDDGQIVFRGDVTRIKTDKIMNKSVSCQPDIQWLADVPDVFSKIVPNETTYYIGYADGVQSLPFWRVDAHNSYVGVSDTYGSYERNSYITLDKIWADYGFRPKMVGKQFAVKFNGETEAREITMRRFYVTRANNVNYPISVLYIGNAGLLYNTFLMSDATQTTVIAYDLAQRQVPTDVPGNLSFPSLSEIRTAEGADAGILSSLDYCIVHYYDPLLDEVTAVHQGEAMGRGRNYSKVYTTVTTTPIPVECSRTTRTTVKNMVVANFNLFGNDNKGYNLFCDERRRIYRGDIEISGELDHSGVDTVYSNISAWLDATDGYARIRREWATVDHVRTLVAYLDLVKESGDIAYDYSVKFAENLADYGSTQDVTGLYTGIFVKGTYSSDDRELTLADSDYEDEPQTVTQDAHYVLDGPKGVVNYNLVLPDDAEDYSWLVDDPAIGDYGKIIMYKEYPLDSVPAGTERQYLYDKAVYDLREALKSYLSFDISAVDNRLLKIDGAGRPVVGNYYAVLLPILDGGNMRMMLNYRQLTKITTDHIKPSASKLTFGDRKNILSDYTAKGAKK